MSEIISALAFLILGYMVGYYRGVLSGYGTKVRESDKSDLFNVHIIENNGVYYFFDHASKKFLLQDTDETVGLNRVKELLPERVQRFVILRSDGNDEPI